MNEIEAFMKLDDNTELRRGFRKMFFYNGEWTIMEKKTAGGMYKYVCSVTDISIALKELGVG